MAEIRVLPRVPAARVFFTVAAAAKGDGSDNFVKQLSHLPTVFEVLVDIAGRQILVWIEL